MATSSFELFHDIKPFISVCSENTKDTVNIGHEENDLNIFSLCFIMLKRMVKEEFTNHYLHRYKGVIPNPMEQIKSLEISTPTYIETLKSILISFLEEYYKETHNAEIDIDYFNSSLLGEYTTRNGKLCCKFNNLEIVFNYTVGCIYGSKSEQEIIKNILTLPSETQTILMIILQELAEKHPTLSFSEASSNSIHDMSQHSENSFTKTPNKSYLVVNQLSSHKKDRKPLELMDLNVSHDEPTKLMNMKPFTMTTSYSDFEIGTSQPTIEKEKGSPSNLSDVFSQNQMGLGSSNPYSHFLKFQEKQQKHDEKASKTLATKFDEAKKTIDSLNEEVRSLKRQLIEGDQAKEDMKQQLTKEIDQRIQLKQTLSNTINSILNAENHSDILQAIQSAQNSSSSSVEKNIIPAWLQLSNDNLSSQMNELTFKNDELQDSNDQFRAMITDLKSTISEKQDQLDEMKIKIKESSQFKFQLDRYKARVEKLLVNKSLIEELQTANDDLSGECKKLRRQLAQMKQIQDRKKHQGVNLKATIDHLKEQLSITTDQHNMLKSQLATVKKELHQEKLKQKDDSEISMVKDETDEEIDSMQHLFHNHLQSSLLNSQKENASLQQEILNLEKDKEKLKNDLYQAQIEMQHLQQVHILNTTNQPESILSEEASVYQKMTNDTLKTKLSNLRTQSAALAQENKEVQVQLESIQQENDQLNALIIDKNEIIGKLQHENNLLLIDNNSKKDAIDMLNQQIVSFHDQLSPIENIDSLSFKELQNSYKTILSQNEALRKQLETLKMDMSLATRQLSKKEVSKSTNSTKKRVAKREKKVLDIAYLKECLDFKEHQIEMLHTKLRIQDLQLKKLQQQIVILNEQQTLRSLSVQYKKKRIIKRKL